MNHLSVLRKYLTWGWHIPSLSMHIQCRTHLGQSPGRAGEVSKRVGCVVTGKYSYESWSMAGVLEKFHSAFLKQRIERLHIYLKV